MKRAGNLVDRIAERDNLRLAFCKAARGKRGHAGVRSYADGLEENLARLRDQIGDNSVSLGRCQQFVIHDPKQRVITAPCFEERVLHHAVMNVCEPVFERWFIDDTFACRAGKGGQAAVARSQEFARRNAFFLKLDVRKYFDSVPHDGLLARLCCLFKDRRLLALFERLVRAFRGSSGRGLPIGSLMSQHFANFYLGWLDRTIKERLRVRGYVRYMDDMAVWGDSAADLRHAQIHCEQFLGDELGLQAKPRPYINRTALGMDFLGCRIFSRHTTLNRRSRVRCARNLRALESRFLCGKIDELELQQRGTAAMAFARAAGVASWRVRTRILRELEVSGPRARTG